MENEHLAGVIKIDTIDGGHTFRARPRHPTPGRAGHLFATAAQNAKPTAHQGEGDKHNVRDV